MGVPACRDAGPGAWGWRPGAERRPVPLGPGRPSATHTASTSGRGSASARTPIGATVSVFCSSAAARRVRHRRAQVARGVSACSGLGVPGAWPWRWGGAKRDRTAGPSGTGPQSSGSPLSECWQWPGRAGGGAWKTGLEAGPGAVGLPSSGSRRECLQRPGGGARPGRWGGA